MPPALEIVEGPVSPDDEHMSLSYGSFDTDESPFPTVARVSPPRSGVITLELRQPQCGIDARSWSACDIFALRSSYVAVADPTAGW